MRKLAEDTLTIREKVILDLVATGLPNKLIAAALYISGETVKKHLFNIYRKLDVTNRVEACAKRSLWKDKMN